MIRSFLSLSKLTALPALALLALATSAQGARAQVGTGSVGVPPLLGSHTKVGATPLLSSQTKVGATPLLTVAQIVAGKLTIDEAWKQNLLSTPIVIELLEKRESLAAGRTDSNLRRDLAGSLVRYAPQIVEDPSQLDARVRLALGRYYSGQGDIKAVDLCETLIREKLEGHEQNQPQGSAADPDDAGSWLHAISLLAQYYENVNQWQKAGETWERALAFRRDAGWWQASIRIDAARAYQRTETPENQGKVAQLYAEVPDYGNGWYTVLARYDHAQPLLQAGKLDEAQAILGAPIQIGEHPEDGIIAQNTWLAQIAYRKGDLDEALRLSKIAVEAGEAVPPTNTWVRGIYSMAQDLYTRSGGWKNQPIQTETKEIIFEINPNEPSRPQYKRFRIKTYGDTSITASVDNPDFQARVLPLNNWQSDGLNSHEQEAEVLVQTSGKSPVADVPLVLSSAVRGKATTIRLAILEKPPS